MKVLIWSNEHNAWWRANSQGYTRNMASAGLYEAEEAQEIVKNCSGRNEQAIALENAFELLQQQARDADEALGKVMGALRATKFLERT